MSKIMPHDLKPIQIGAHLSFPRCHFCKIYFNAGDQVLYFISKESTHSKRGWMTKKHRHYVCKACAHAIREGKL